MATEKYKHLKSLARGRFGMVSMCKGNTSEGNIVAKKRITLKDPEEGVPSSLLREVSLLKELEHENIVKLVNVLSGKSKIDLVFEHLDTDLHMLVLRQPSYLNDGRIKRYLHQILSGVAHCHHHKIVHGDLKLGNVLVDFEKDIVKLADFGMARPIGMSLDQNINQAMLSWGDSGLSKPVGVTVERYSEPILTAVELPYMPPELVLGNGQTYTTAIDIWSIGCIFAGMVTRRYLFDAKRLDEVSPVEQVRTIFSVMGTPDEGVFPGHDVHVPKIKAKDLAKVVPGLELTGLNLLKRMLCLDPSKRISAEEALEHDYFKDVNAA